MNERDPFYKFCKEQEYEQYFLCKVHEAFVVIDPSKETPYCSMGGESITSMDQVALIVGKKHKPL